MTMRCRRASIPLLLCLLIIGPTVATAEDASPGAGEKSAKAATPKKHGEKSHKAKHGGQLGMWKQWHVEVAIPAPGSYQVWLTDAYGKPLPLEGIGGTLTVTPADAGPKELPLVPDEKKQYLGATSDEVKGTLETEVQIAGLPEKVSMEFHWEKVGEAESSTATASAPSQEAAPSTQPSSATQPTEAIPLSPEEAATGAAKGEEPKPMKHGEMAHHAGHGGQLGMVADWHIEMTVPKPGQYQVFLTDAYGKAAAMGKLAGTLTVTDASGKAVELPLAAAGDHLEASGDPLTGQLTLDASVTGADPKPIEMELVFDVK